MRFKGRKWASPFFIISLAVAGLFGVTAGIISRNNGDAFQKTNAAETYRVYFNRPTWAGDNGSDHGVWAHYYNYQTLNPNIWVKMTWSFQNWSNEHVYYADIPMTNVTNLQFQCHQWENDSWNEKNSTTNTELPTNSHAGYYCNNDWYAGQFNTGTYPVRFVTFEYDGNGASAGSVASTTFIANSKNPYNVASNSFTRPMYDFNGWNTEPDGSGTSYTAGSSLTQQQCDSFSDNEVVKLYAQWSLRSDDKGNILIKLNSSNANRYNFYFYDNNSHNSGWNSDLLGSQMDSLGTYYYYYEIGSAWSFTPTNMILRLASNRDDKYPSSGGIGLDSNALSLRTYYDYSSKTWKNNSFTISYNANGGSGSISQQEVFYGDSVTLTTNTNQITRGGYTFAGWATSSSGEVVYSNGATIDKDSAMDIYLDKKPGGTLTLYAKWTAASYAVTFDNGDGEGGSISKTTYNTSTSSQTITITAPTKTGYHSPSYSITRTGDYGGTAPSVSGTTVTIPAGSYGTFTINTTWTARTTTVTLDPNGGIAGTTEVTATYNKLMPGIGTLPTKTGYNFHGFYDTDEPTGGTKYYNSTGTAATSWDQDVATSILYARWVETSYYVEYVGNEPSGTATDIPEDDYWAYDHDSTLGSAPSLAGYTFTGWYSDAACQNRLGDADQLIHNANLSSDGSKAYIYAGWAASECTVTITVNDSRYGSVDKLSISNVPLGSSVSINGNKITIAGTTVTASTKAAPDGYDNSFVEWTNAPATITGAVTITATFTQISGETAAISYAQAFNTAIAAKCSESGATDVTELAKAWSTQATNYGNLAGYVQYWLDKDHASSDTNVTNMFRKYDYVYGKYGSDVGTDFLNRNPDKVGAIRNFTPFDLLNNGDDNNVTTVIVIVSSAVALLSITALSVLMVKKRKRKEY